MKKVAYAILMLFLSVHIGLAKDVRITDGAASVQFMINARQFSIERNQDTSAIITGEFARIARPCPSQCIVPHVADPQIINVSELEIMDFLRRSVANDQGLVVDTRVPDDFSKGHIPAAINIPGAALDADNPYREDIFLALNGQKGTDRWTFPPDTKTLLLYAGGAWDDSAAKALRALLQAGYPARKLRFYRGGMQSWVILGLSTQTTSN